MGFVVLSEGERFSRKNFRCAWCGEVVQAGSLYKFQNSVGEDGFSALKFDPWCFDAMERECADMEPGDFWELHANHPGMTEYEWQAHCRQMALWRAQLAGLSADGAEPTDAQSSDLSAEGADLRREEQV